MTHPAQKLNFQSDLGAQVQGLSCVMRGTMIATRRGEIAVQDLTADDEVITRDGGLTAVRWVGAIVMDADLDVDNAPIKVPAGAVGHRVPARDTYLAPDARIWMQGAEFVSAFTSREVLVPVRALAGWRGITQVTNIATPQYYLLLCDGPQIVTADGMQIEMCHPGAVLKAFVPLVQDPMAELFPELIELTGVGTQPRRRLNTQEAGQVIEVRKRA